ncbi:MAG TPA: hypothetical protein VMM14_08545 [Acidimicrobiia bacterium]|nr:hypothetical protein [Acidimicrobiia bacterium]
MSRLQLLSVVLMAVVVACSSPDEDATSTPSSDDVVTTSTVSAETTSTVFPETTSPPAETTTSAPEATETTSDRPLAPDFTLTLGDGGEYTLSEGAKPVYLVFWAEW